jgi:prepilin-type N-terminal cleavage/methylation domain-containing protein
MKNSKCCDVGFTLTELMMVIAVIAILMAILLPVANTTMENIRYKQATAEISMIEAALETYYSDHGEYPDTSAMTSEQANEHLSDCLTSTYTVGGRDVGPYLRMSDLNISDDTGNIRLLDPWKSIYFYEYPGTPGQGNAPAFPNIASAGSDGDEGISWQTDTGSYNAADPMTSDNICNWAKKK